jgi:hypothetical protein
MSDDFFKSIQPRVESCNDVQQQQYPINPVLLPRSRLKINLKEVGVPSTQNLPTYQKSSVSEKENLVPAWWLIIAASHWGRNRRVCSESALIVLEKILF